MTYLSCWIAADVLGSTLAEWQRRREEEEAASRAAMFSGGGGDDEEEEASDVHAEKRAKVMAKNQAKRDQESRWAAALIATVTLAIFSFFFPAVVVAAPIVLVGTAILAVGIDITLSLTINKSIKEDINTFLDSYDE